MTTFRATTPDGHTDTRTSRTRVYTHARWIKFSDDNHQVIVSWHMTELAAHKSPFQSATWKHLPHGVVPVTSDAAPAAAEVAPAAEPAAPVARPHKGATRAVLRNLDRETTMNTRAFESLTLASLEAFRDDATRWLGDKSELKSATIERADWVEVYEYFRGEVGPAAPAVEVEPAGVVYVSRSTSDAADVPVPVERDARWWDMSSPAERAAADAAEAVQWWEVTSPSTHTGRGFVMAVQAADALAAVVAVCDAVGVGPDGAAEMSAAAVAGPVAAHSARVLHDPTADAYFGACVCSWTHDGMPHVDEWSAKRDGHRHVSRARQADRLAAAAVDGAAQVADEIADGIYAARLAIRARAIRAGLIPAAAASAPAVEVDPAAQLAADVARPPVTFTPVTRRAALPSTQARDAAAASAPAVEVAPSPWVKLAAEVAAIRAEHPARRAEPVEVAPAVEVEPVDVRQPVMRIEYSTAGARVTDGTRSTGRHIRPEAAWRAWRDEFGDLAPDAEPEPAASRRAAITARIEQHHAEWWHQYGAKGMAAYRLAREAGDLLDAARRELADLDASYPLDVRAFGYATEHGRVEYVPNCRLFPGTHGYVAVEPDGHEQWHRDKWDAERWLAQRAAL